MNMKSIIRQVPRNEKSKISALETHYIANELTREILTLPNFMIKQNEAVTIM